MTTRHPRWRKAHREMVRWSSTSKLWYGKRTRSSRHKSKPKKGLLWRDSSERIGGRGGRCLPTHEGRAYTEAERAYNGDMGEGAERASLSSCGKGTTTDKAGIYEEMNTTSRVGVSFGTRLPETFYEEFASILEACVIEDEIAMEHGARNKVATNMTSRSDGAGTFPTPILETLAVGHKSPCEPEETEGGGKAGNQNNNEKNDGVGTFPTPILETLAVGHEIPREPEEKESGGKAGDRDNDKENEESSSGRRRDSPTPVPETSEVAPEHQRKTVKRFKKGRDP